jgi:hypothetical protein
MNDDFITYSYLFNLTGLKMEDNNSKDEENLLVIKSRTYQDKTNCPKKIFLISFS